MSNMKEEGADDNYGVPPSQYVPNSRLAKFLTEKIGWELVIPILVIFPAAFLAIMFGAIPLGDPNQEGMRHQAVFVFIFNPFIAIAVGYLHAAVFLASMEYPRPFRATAYICVTIYAGQVLLFGPMLPFVPPFKFLGAVSLVWTLIMVYGDLFIRFYLFNQDEELKQKFIKKFVYYFRVIIGFVLFVVILTLFIFAFRYANDLTQRFLSPILAFVVFIFKIILLAITDDICLETQVLISGLWLQNIEDVLQTIAFPYVREPSTYAIIFATNALKTMALLSFLFPWWFSFRLWILNFLKNVFKCNFPIPPTPEADETENMEDRGHSPNRGGYHRRTVKFYFWKIASQMTAMCFFLSFSPIMRYGLNSDYFPLSKPSLTILGFDNEQYKYAMIYSAANLVWHVVIAFVSDRFLAKFHTRVYRQVRRIQKQNLQNLTYIGIVIAVITSNIVIAVSLMLYQYKIWWAF